MMQLAGMLLMAACLDAHVAADPHVEPFPPPDLHHTRTPWAEPPARSPANQDRPAPASALGGQGNAQRSPRGALSNIVVYCSAGHGFTLDSGGTAWITGRPLLDGMVEDMGNIDQLNFFAQYCFNAGATVVPFRPLGCQTNEVVLDNDDVGVSFEGAWNDSDATLEYYGTSGDTPFRYAFVNTNAETARARYRPTLPEAGEYPVYTWVRDGTDRVRQLYRIVHSGGTSEVVVNHRRVGCGWIWLGNYHFGAGTNGGVDVSNFARGPYTAATHVVIADTVRFGNGMGDISRGPGVSGLERELEAARYWIERALGAGMPTTLYDLSGYSDSDDNIGAPARMANYMNNTGDGTYHDRVYVGFHSNAGSGTGRGAMGLYSTGNSAAKQAQQQALGGALNDELDADMEWGDNGVLFNDDWTDNSSDLYGSVYGEISDNSNSNMNSTIIEVAFHDNAEDTKLLKDPCARNIMGRACYQGLIRYLHSVNSTVPLALLPDPPTSPSVVNSGKGRVTVSWSPPATNAAGGDAATGYVVYQSSDGYGFDAAGEVAGESSNHLVLTNLPAGTTLFIRVAAVNAGGESLPSETAAVRTAPEGRAFHLLVQGFDRADRSLSPTRYFAFNLGGSVTLVRPRQINSYDYAVPHGAALAAADATFDCCSHAALLAGAPALTNYLAAWWMLGEESTMDETFSTAEQSLLTNFLARGGCLFASGAEIGWDLDHLGSAGDRTFFTNQLRAAYVADDAGTNIVTGRGGSIFEGLPASAFAETAGATYGAEYPDVLTARGGAVTALVYGSSSGGTQGAAVQYSNTFRLVVMGFPFETLASAAARTAVVARVVRFFGDTERFDGDGDGLPDRWECEHFDAAHAWVGTDDADADGQDNRTEYIAGTQPTNAASSWMLLSAMHEIAGCVLLWPGATDRVYTVSISTNLASGFQTLASGLPVAAYTDAVPRVETPVFYRIEATRPEP